jgi:hypothetical protein
MSTVLIGQLFISIDILFATDPGLTDTYAVSLYEKKT